MQRFQRRYVERQTVGCGALKKWGAIAAGALLMVVGLILLPLPGPGMLVMFAGAVTTGGASTWFTVMVVVAEPESALPAVNVTW